MALPSKKTPRHRSRMRHAHDALVKITLASCPRCGLAKLPHILCPHCGIYNGREVVKVVSAKEKERRKEQKEKRLQTKLKKTPAEKTPATAGK